MTTLHNALVLKSTGSWYTLRDDHTGTTYECRIRGNLRLKASRTTNPVVVGDHVAYDPAELTIEQVLPRRNYIIRRASNLSKESHIIAANIDQVFLVVSLFQPATNYEFIDRFLVTAEAYQIPAILLLNKCDLYTSDTLRAAHNEFVRIYTEVGYEVMELSVHQMQGIKSLSQRLEGRTSLFSGNSGVGKSSIIRTIDPHWNIRVGEVSASTERGKHTTTFSEMYALPQGGYLVDTPGIKGFGLIDIAPQEICHYFRDLRRYAPQCEYTDCTHTHEPSCAVRQALEEGLIAPTRYESYLKLLDDDQKYRK